MNTVSTARKAQENQPKLEIIALKLTIVRLEPVFMSINKCSQITRAGEKTHQQGAQEVQAKMVPILKHLSSNAILMTKTV